MDYDEGRLLSVRQAYIRTIKLELDRGYRPGQPTVVLLPGGMGSQLDRSPTPWRDRLMELDRYDPVWLDLGVLFDRDALTLEIHNGRDKDGHIIVPNGPLRFLVRAYDGTEAYFRQKGFNYVVFGYDWRRPVEDGAEWLEWFLRHYRERVQERHGEDPLPLTTLLGHSQGGLVIKLFLDRLPGSGLTIDRAITAGTPFYGTSTHIQRYYDGERALNRIYRSTEVARIIGTLPGPYVLMYLPQPVFTANRNHLAGLGLADYPCVDHGTGAACDCYDAANGDRFPASVSRRHLADALAACAALARPLATAQAAQFHNIRSLGEPRTITLLRWRTGWRPGQAAPFDSERGPGDGTVPGWSAFHASAPDDPEHRITVPGSVKHMDLMESRWVLDSVASLVLTGRLPVVPAAAPELVTPAEERASPAEVEQLLDDVGAGRAQRDDPRLRDPRVWREIYREMKQ